MLRVSIALGFAFIAATPDLLPGQVTGYEGEWGRADSVVVVGKSRIRLRSSAWRDFMPQPGGARPGSHLMVNLQIENLEALPLPPGLAVDSAWVRSSSEKLWRTAPNPEPRPDLPNGLDLILRGGPKWSTNETIDVLVRLRLPNAEVRYLQTRRQGIGRTS